MIKLLKTSNLSGFSFSTKVIFLFLFLVLFASIIKTLIVIPQVEQKKYEQELANINKLLNMSKEEIAVLGKAISMQTDLERELSKKRIENELKKIDLETQNKEELLNSLELNETLNICKYKITNKVPKLTNLWEVVEVEDLDKGYRKRKIYRYSHNFKKYNLYFTVNCKLSNLNPNHMPFELDIKKHFNANLLSDPYLTSSKTAIIWLNNDVLEGKNDPLYVEEGKKRKEKYGVSMLSTVRNIPTGDLTRKEILDNRDKDPIEHIMDGKKVITWIYGLGSYDTSTSLFIHSVDKQDILNKTKSQYLSLFTETLLALGLSFIMIFIVIRKRLKKIDKLTKTAILVNKGEKNIRSEVKGDDDIGVLGESFDKMLDFFENNIKTLDIKVQEKTKEISRSLEEKEILLKEIHHRVKNNLALTIGLIELQEEDISDEKTKKVLRDISERIYTMELLHRKLYESDDLNKIVLKNYVSDLIASINDSYNTKKDVSISIEVDKLELNIEAVMPLGIIINEFVTNAFKYAFLKDKNHHLKINISNPKNDEIEISVKDSGEGLKEDFSAISNKTLGLKLINMIVTYQLSGSISYKYEDGALFTIKGKIPNF